MIENYLNLFCVAYMLSILIIFDNQFACQKFVLALLGFLHFICFQDLELLAKWRQAIPRKDLIFDSRHYLCELHFDKEFIDCTSSDDIDGSGKKSERIYHRLKEGAIPSKFPNVPKYLSKQNRKRKAPAPRTATSSKKRLLDAESSCIKDFEIPEDIFATIKKKLPNVIKPSESWMLSESNEYFALMKFNNDFICERHIIIGKDLLAKVRIYFSS